MTSEVSPQTDESQLAPMAKAIFHLSFDIYHLLFLSL